MTFLSVIPRRAATRAPVAPLGLRGFWPAELDRFFDEALHGFGVQPGAGEAQAEAQTFTPRIDVSETEEAYTIEADLPGFEEKDLQVSLEEGVLTLQGKHASEKQEERQGRRWVERASGSFHRALALPQEVAADKVSATYKQGVLTVTLPKVPAAKPQVRSIPVTTA